MERQLNGYVARYKSAKKINELTELQLDTLTALIKKGVEQAPVGKEFDIYYIMKRIREEYKQAEALSGINLGIGEIGHVIVSMDSVKWINCQCGGVGKFRRER